MADSNKRKESGAKVLSREQEVLLETYLESLDDFYSSLQESEKVQAEIETLHLKRILTK